MKKLVFSSLFFLLLLYSSNIFALPDNEVQELARISSNFKQAEDRILKTWFSLPKEFRKQLQKNQIEWIKTTRDKEANVLISKGISKEDSYADVTNFRSDYLENLAKNYFNNQSTLHIEIICGDIEVLKNNAGDIVWPKKDESKICNERLGQTVGQHKGNQSFFTVTHGPDFDMPLVLDDSGCCYEFPKVLEPKGYQSTATIEAKFYKDGVVRTITEPVTWTIEDVQNRAPSWNRASNAKNGLVWGDTVDPSNSFGYMWTNDEVGGSVPNAATIKLTDVVGQRTVKLRAKTAIGGVTYSDTTVVTFGKGPLSVFTKPPSSGMRWATARGIPATAGSFGDFTALTNPSGFPAAAFCGGTVHTGSSDIMVGGSGLESYTVDFTYGINSNHWRDRSTDKYYSLTSKLPTLGQLMAVSAYNSEFINHIKSKGAAQASGWPDDAGNEGVYRYWTGQVRFDSFGFFVADSVDLAFGLAVWYGGVTHATPVVACVH